jgi:hypothetical protein
MQHVKCQRDAQQANLDWRLVVLRLTAECAFDFCERCFVTSAGSGWSSPSANQCLLLSGGQQSTRWFSFAQNSCGWLRLTCSQRFCSQPNALVRGCALSDSQPPVDNHLFCCSFSIQGMRMMTMRTTTRRMRTTTTMTVVRPWTRKMHLKSRLTCLVTSFLRTCR